MIKLNSICEIGNTLHSLKRIPYISENTFLDFEGIILSYQTGIINPWKNTWKNKYLKRRNDLVEFINHKNTPIIVFAPTPFEHIFDDRTTFLPDTAIPGGNFKVISEVGEKMNIIKRTPFSIFFEKYINHFSYSSFFIEFKGQPTIETPHTKKVLAFYNKNVVFLPHLKSIPENLEEFVADLFIAAKKIRGTLQIEQPEWAKSYFLPKEKAILVEASKVESQIHELTKALQEKKEALELFERRKEMFCGSGDSLEDEIKKIFSELGFKILESDPNRDDITIEYNGQVAVVEIKGVNGSSSEGHATQLEKWATMHYEKHQKHPKAILIVNSFKEKPLNKRVEETFPNQMLDYSVGRKHCLISTIQFLGLYYDALGSNKKDDLINTLFETVGVYKGYENWGNFIEFEETKK